MSEERNINWRVTWGLDIFPDDGSPIFDAPDLNGFRLSFPTPRAAAQFKAEIQRFIGALLLETVQEGIKIKALS